MTLKQIKKILKDAPMRYLLNGDRIRGYFMDDTIMKYASIEQLEKLHGNGEITLSVIRMSNGDQRLFFSSKDPKLRLVSNKILH